MLSYQSMGEMINEDLVVSKEREIISGVPTGRAIYTAKTVNPASPHSAVVGRGDSELDARNDWFRRAEDRWQY